MSAVINAQKQAVHGLTTCACGCTRTFPKSKNRNGIERRFYNAKCRAAWDRIARQFGHVFQKLGMSMSEKIDFIDSLRKAAPGRIAVVNKSLVEVRHKRQEYVDLDRMQPWERLGALCRAAERWKVIE